MKTIQNNYLLIINIIIFIIISALLLVSSETKYKNLDSVKGENRMVFEQRTIYKDRNSAIISYFDEEGNYIYQFSYKNSFWIKSLATSYRKESDYVSISDLAQLLLSLSEKDPDFYIKDIDLSFSNNKVKINNKSYQLVKYYNRLVQINNQKNLTKNTWFEFEELRELKKRNLSFEEFTVRSVSRQNDNIIYQIETSIGNKYILSKNTDTKEIDWEEIIIEERDSRKRTKRSPKPGEPGYIFNSKRSKSS